MIDNKYIPCAKFEKGILSRLCFKIKFDDSDVEPFLCSIQQGDSSMVDNELMALDDDEISEYDKADRKLYEWLLNKKQYLSEK